MTVYKCHLSSAEDLVDEDYEPECHLVTENFEDLVIHATKVKQGEEHVVLIINGPENHQEIDFKSLEDVVSRGRKL